MVFKSIPLYTDGMGEDQIAEPTIHIICAQKDIDLTFPILSRGFHLSRDPWSCKVLSQHKGVINLLDRNTGLLTSLIEDQSNMTAMSLLVPEIFTSATVRFNHESLLDRICNISINGKCEDWKGDPPRMSEGEDGLKRNLTKIMSHLDEGLSFISLLTGNCTDSFQAKGKSILDHSIRVKEGKIRGLEALIGLGRGMTPSGDDFITGVLLAANCLNRWETIDREAILLKSPSTTYGGRTLLTLALKGSFPSYLITFLEEYLCADNEENMFRALDKAALHGSTSGRDSLAGFLWFLRMQ